MMGPLANIASNVNVRPYNEGSSDSDDERASGGNGNGGGNGGEDEETEAAFLARYAAEARKLAGAGPEDPDAGRALTLV